MKKMKKNLLLTIALMASMIVGAINYNLEFGWHSVLQGNQQSIPMWSDTSADGKLLTLARFQSKEEADEYTFLGLTFNGTASNNVPNGSNNIVLTKSDFLGNAEWALTTNRGDVNNGLNYATATKDGGVFLALSVRHTDKDDPTLADNVLLRIKDGKNAVHTVTWQRPTETWVHQPLFIKVDKDGGVEWTKLASVGYEPAPAKPDKEIGTAFDIDGVAEDAEGNLYISGALARQMIVDGVTIDYHNVSPDWNGDYVQNRQGNSFLLKLNSTGTAQWAKVSGGEATRDQLKNIVVDNGYLYGLGTVKGKESTAYSWGDKTINPNTDEGFYAFKMNIATENFEWLSYFPGFRVNSANMVNNEEIRIKDGKLIAIGRFSGGFALDPNATGATWTGKAKNQTPWIFTVDTQTGQGLNAAIKDPAIGNGGTNYTGLFFKDNNIWVWGYNFSFVYLDVYDMNLTLTKTYENIVKGSVGMATTFNCAEKDGKMVLMYRAKGEFSTTIGGGQVLFPNNPDYSAFMAAAIGINLVPDPGTGIETQQTENTFHCYAVPNAVRVVAQEPTAISVYGINGVLLASQTTSVGQTDIELPKGVYIVRSNGGTQKVVVR
jgi:hypothetical protein